MCLLFESIKIEDRKFCNLEAHLQRMNASVQKLWNIPGKFTTSDIQLPASLTREVYKCRVIYQQNILSVEVKLYHKKTIKKIRMLEMNEIDYSLKYLDRSIFEELFTAYPGFDDFIILQNGKVCDSTFSNLVFQDGRDWYTPRTYLLKGIKRTALLKNNLIREINIEAMDIVKYQSISFINAMLDPGELVLETTYIE